MNGDNRNNIIIGLNDKKWKLMQKIYLPRNDVRINEQKLMISKQFERVDIKFC